MVYGEIALRDFTELLDKYGATDAAGGGGGPDGGRAFWDLGCGTGKACSPPRCAAIPPTRTASSSSRAPPPSPRFSSKISSATSSRARARVNPLRSVSARVGDIFAADATDAWTRGDFVFCNCVTWDDETMTRLSAAAERMRPGSIFVTVLCPLASDTFELVEEVELNFSWGAVECLVHRRMTDEAWRRSRPRRGRTREPRRTRGRGHGTRR